MAEDLQLDVSQTFVSCNYHGGVILTGLAPTRLLSASLFVSGYAGLCGTARWGEAHNNSYRRDNSLLSTSLAGKHFVVHKEGQLGFIPPSPYSCGERMYCRGGRGAARPLPMKARDNLQRLCWPSAARSLALRQRRCIERSRASWRS